MLLSIRKTRRSGAFEDPTPEQPARAVDLLLACHGRIRSYAALGERLAAAPKSPAPEIAEVARSLHRYHHLALPLHEADEERSIRPRLMAASAPDAVLAALAAMEDEHRQVDAIVAELLAAWSAIAEDPALLSAHARHLVAPTAALRVLWASHLAREEAQIFPAVSLLPPDIEHQIMSEMRARRAPFPDSSAGAAPRAAGPLP